MTKKKPDRIKRRILILGIVFGIFFTAITARAVHLHMFMGPWLSQKADGQVKRSVQSMGDRGSIFDTNLGKMALSIDMTSVGAHPSQIEDVAGTARALSEILEVNRKELVSKLNSKVSFVWIERHVAPQKANMIKDLDLAGVVFKNERSRVYPYRTLAAQVLGFSGVDGRGLEGLEFYYDRYLEGEPRQFKIVRDAMGRGLGLDVDINDDAHNGKNIILTIDRRVQYIAETALAEAVIENRAESGIAVVMAPETGAILAMAHYPFFNPNTFGQYGRQSWRNRAVTDFYEPGSTLKVFSAAAAIEYGVSGPHSILYCENGAYRVGRNTVHDIRPHQWLSLEQIIKYSSNIGAAKLSEMIGSKNLYHTLKQFGFGERTGIDCPGETPGMLSSYQRWSKIDAAAIAFGQGISVSAIQLITAISAIANDGILMKPYIVDAITDKNGALIEKFDPLPVRRAVSPQTAATLKSILARVTEDGGTGVNAALDGYRVCGKTGTAQKVGASGTYERGRYVSSFVGFVPSQNPEVAILVIIDEPKKAHYGGVVAAPVFRQIAHQTLNYMNVPPEGRKDHLTVSKEEEVKG